MAPLPEEDREAIRFAVSRVAALFADELDDSENLEAMWQGWSSFLREISVIAIMIGESYEGMERLRNAGWRIYNMRNSPRPASDLL